MNTKVKAMNAANAVTWVRARKLCEHVPDTNSNQARSFLSENKKGPYPELLGSENCDKRNPTVRRMIKEFVEYCKTNKGRAGRKNGQIPTLRLGIEPKPKPKRTRRKTWKATAKNTITPEALVKIRKFVEEFGTIEKLEEGLQILKGLQLK